MVLSADHSTIMGWLKNNIYPNKNFRESLEEIPEILKGIKDFEEKPLFNWEDIPGKDSKDLITFLIDDYDLNWVNESQIKKTNEKEIKITNNTNEVILSLAAKNDLKIKIIENNNVKHLRRDVFYKGKKIDNFTKIFRKSKRYLISPKLPIDLILIEPEEEYDYEKRKIFVESHFTFFLIVVTQPSPELIEDLVFFYKFYLSRVISLNRFKIIIITSDGIKISQKFLEDNGIGLWQFIDASSKKPKIILSPFTPREKMAADFLKKFNTHLLKKSTRSAKVKNEIALFLDNCVHDAITAVIGYKQEELGKGYIDSKILFKLSHLKRISFKDDLNQLVSIQLSEKNDEYFFASEVFQKLWEDNLTIPYSNFLEIFEPSLQYISVEKVKMGEKAYRDHYIHQFQVFLLGLLIIDEHYEYFSSKYDHPEICWLIASSFHDIAYPVQLYDIWNADFFKKVFNLSCNPGIFELKSKFIDERFLCCMGRLICSLCETQTHEPLPPTWMEPKNDLVQFFYNQITLKKTHGIMSSVSLLKMVQSKMDDPIFKENIEKKYGSFEPSIENLFIKSAVAIALHEEKIWSAKLKMSKNGDYSKGKRLIKQLNFDDDPLSFLLIFCDTIHEWGRPSKSEESDLTGDQRNDFLLKDLDINPDTVKITLWSPDYEAKKELFGTSIEDCHHNKKNLDFFGRKYYELKRVQLFLKSIKIKFIIRLEDNHGNGKNFEF
jgi:hypothetical protein